MYDSSPVIRYLEAHNRAENLKRNAMLQRHLTQTSIAKPDAYQHSSSTSSILLINPATIESANAEASLKYDEMRVKNNAASRLSRARRAQRELKLIQHYQRLENENASLKVALKNAELTDKIKTKLLFRFTKITQT